MSAQAVAWALAQPVCHSPAKFILVVLAHYAHGKQAPWSAFASTTLIAQQTGQDRKTVLANLRRLIDAGFLVDSGERAGANKSVVVFRLCEPSSSTNSGTASEQQSGTENGTASEAQAVRVEAGTFSCPEHAIAVAYLMLAMPIEPKNPTQLVCEALRERFDVEYERKALSGLSPLEWHAQAVFIVKLMERTLGDSVGFHILRAQYGTGEQGAASARRISEWLNPEAPADGREREVTDLLAAHILRGRPWLRDL